MRRRFQRRKSLTYLVEPWKTYKFFHFDCAGHSGDGFWLKTEKARSTFAARMVK
jgi:hypothetical protein